jgi:hypothetical protein
MPIKYKKYEKLIHNKPGEKVFVEGYVRGDKFTTIFKIKGDKQKWIFEKLTWVLDHKDFEKFYKLIKE